MVFPPNAMAQQLITQQQVLEAISALQEWSTTPEQKTIADLLAAINRPIARMLENGVTYEEVADKIAELEISVTAGAIEAYLKQFKGKRPKRKNEALQTELNQAISQEQLEQGIALIKEMSKQRRGLTRAEFVAANYQIIELCLAAGKSFSKISVFLESHHEIKIAASTLAKYYQQAKQARSQETQLPVPSLQVPKPSESEVKHPLPEKEINLSEFNL